MKIFTEGNSYQDKVNFVDENNNAVGYDLGQDCCEDADWFITDRIIKGMTYEDCDKYRDCKELENIDNYNFDPTFILVEHHILDDGGSAIFKLKGNNLKTMYLHLFNSHNGYYSHGFDFSMSGVDYL